MSKALPCASPSFGRNLHVTILTPTPTTKLTCFEITRESVSHERTQRTPTDSVAPAAQQPATREMVLTTKQTKVSAPAAPSRSSSSTTAPKATKRASLNVKPATSVPSAALKESYVDRTGIISETINPVPQLPSPAKHDVTGPFADNPKFLASPKKVAAAKRLKPRPTKRPSKVHKKRRTTQQLSDIITLLTKITFLLFSIYSLLVCPKDVKMESPVCRGLDYYRKTIVDPYILPPLRAVVTHPAIAPQIERARPYVDQAVDVAKTQYNIARDKIVVAADPYVVLARKQYNARARTQVRLMQYNMRRYQRQAQPYVDLAKAKALQGWAQAEVYVLPILSKLEQTPMLLKNFIKPLEEGKERWVDPQVKKIVDKVHEMSASAAVVAEEKNASSDDAITSAAKSSPVSDGTSATTEKATFYSSPSIPTAVSITETTSTIASEEPPAPTVPEPAPEESAQTSISEAPPTRATVTSEAAPSESAYDPLDEPLINPNYDEDVEDIEFFEDLEKWVAEALHVEQATTSAEMPPKPTRLTAEEKAEKKRILAEETAIKRKDIMARHDKWERELEALVALKASHLREFLDKSRQEAFKELSSPQSVAHSQLNGIKTQLKDAVKATQKTLAKMRDDWEDNYREMDEDFMDKLPRWAQTLEGIEFSFSQRSEKLNKGLGDWISAWVQKESEALRDATEEVNKFVEKAQGDLIADYAWLNDVTHRDWDRYHKLMFRSREVAEEFQKLYNGHSEPVLGNPVQEEIARIEDHLYRATLDFKSGVDNIRKEGWKYLLGDVADGTVASEENTGADEKADKVTEPTGTAAEEPAFSILPIDLDERIDAILVGGEAIIGKSKEQVEQAVLMAEEAATEAGKKMKDAVVGHEEL